MPVAREGGYLTSFFSEADCNRAREARPHPEDFYCLRFESPKTIDYKFPKDLRQEGSNDAPPEPNPKLSDPAGIQTKNDDVQLAGGRYHYSRPLFLWIKTTTPRSLRLTSPISSPELSLRHSPPNR